MTKVQKKTSLIKYSELLKQKLVASVPTKHEHRIESYRQMLQIDLKKTLAKIETL